MRATSLAVVAGTFAGLVVMACTDSTQKTIAGPELSGPRNSTTFGGSGVFTYNKTVVVCVDASSPGASYTFKNTEILGNTSIAGFDFANGGDGTSTPNAASGVGYLVAKGACQTVLTRNTPDSCYNTCSDTWSGITVTATVPGGQTYVRTDCLLDIGVHLPYLNPCDTNNNPTRGYMNNDHGSKLTFVFGSVTSTGKIAPTATTCQDYADGTSATLSNILVGFKGTTANSISPGVFFYYAHVTKTAGQTVGFTQSISPNPGTLPLYPVQQTQAYLYSSSCTTVATLALGAGGTTATGGTSLPAGNYILGVKFNPGVAKGTIVPSALLTASGSLLATHNYEATLDAAPVATTTASVNTSAK